MNQGARLRRSLRAETRRNLEIDGVEIEERMKWMAASRSIALVFSGPPLPPAPVCMSVLGFLCI